MKAILVISSHGEVPPRDGFLSGGEESEFAVLLAEKRRRDWLCARFAAKKAFLEAWPDCGLGMKEITVSKTPAGEPFFVAGGQRRPQPLSLSHSAGHAAAALGLDCRAIGVDLEKIEARPQCWIDDCFQPSEIPVGADAAYCTELWAKKEAVLKALGIGLSADLYDVRFDGGCHKPAVFSRARKAWQDRGGGKFLMRVHRMPEGCVTCVAMLS
ncbi:MAG: 4'-phosphopantetheinyl transferase superfamily protein [Elusimicrobiales bacterium]